MLSQTDLISVPLGKIVLRGNLIVPKGATGLVLFAHGSGSGRKSPRNRFVAKVLQDANLATLLIDLLTLEEESVDRETKQVRFDIPFLAKRLLGITDWLKKNALTKSLKIGYFGASTGAAAALVAAAERGKEIFAVVSRGGRADLGGEHLTKVVAPTLLIIGGRDEKVIELNQEALALLKCEKKLSIIDKASHLFEEPGALEEVAKLAKNWFQSHL